MIVATSPLQVGHKRRILVPTMGALHDGHRALIRRARDIAGDDGEVVVSIFVNPTQFAPGEDFDRYPRMLENDVHACEAEGVDIVYAPDVRTVYGESDARERVTIDPGALGGVLEGAQRPGHFAGVLTVVSILFQQVAPEAAVFGEKDYQQLELIRRMCRDLSLAVRVVGVPTVRDSDGLAMSSRNAYLTPDDRSIALAIPRALDAGASAARRGPRAAEADARAILDDAGIEVHYVTVRGPSLDDPPASGSGRLLIAAGIGAVRLIDNCEVELAAVTDDE